MTDKQRKPLLEKLEPTHKPLIGNAMSKGLRKEANYWMRDVRRFVEDIFRWLGS